MKSGRYDEGLLESSLALENNTNSATFHEEKRYLGKEKQFKYSLKFLGYIND